MRGPAISKKALDQRSALGESRWSPSNVMRLSMSGAIRSNPIARTIVAASDCLVPAEGTVVKMVGYHDNSEKNPANPNKPPKRIKYGEGTADEMSLVIFEATCDSVPELLMLLANNAAHLKVLERFPLKMK